MKNVLIILFLHWVFDFVFQTDDMALNKSKDNFWLTVHVFVYSIGLACMAVITIGFNSSQAAAFVLINALIHWTQDWFTSRLNAYLYQKEMRHWFFVAIGFDQLLHYTALLMSYELIV